MALLEIRGLEKTFGGIKALQGVDFSIDEGEIVSVIGPNGAGKTSFFNVISGMFPPDAGTIKFDGDDLAGHEPNEITTRGIARTFQNVRLFPNMTVLENVMVGQHCRTKAGIFGAIFTTPETAAEEKMIEEKAKDILGFFGSRLAGYRHDQLAYVALLRQPEAARDRTGHGHRAPAPAARRAHRRDEPEGNHRVDRVDRRPPHASGDSPWS